MDRVVSVAGLDDERSESRCAGRSLAMTNAVDHIVSVNRSLGMTNALCHVASVGCGSETSKSVSRLTVRMTLGYAGPGLAAFLKSACT